MMMINKLCGAEKPSKLKIQKQFEVNITENKRNLFTLEKEKMKELLWTARKVLLQTGEESVIFGIIIISNMKVKVIEIKTCQ